MLLPQRHNQGIQRPAHHIIEPIQRQIDSVIGDPTLRKVIGANPLRAITRTHERAPLGCLGGFLAFLLSGQQASLQ